MFAKETVVDCKGHLLGRLASVVAKELINGQKVTLVRCEDINISGSLYRNQLKWQAFKNIRTSTNPKKGPFHQRAPSKMIMRTIRGMVPYKTAKGAKAMDNLTAVEGIPYPFNLKKRLVVPAALKNIRLKPHRKFCKLGDISTSFGWHHQALIERLETTRKVKSGAFYKKKVAAKKAELAALKGVASKLDRDILVNTGSVHPKFF